MQYSGFDFKLARINRKLKQIDVAKIIKISNTKLSLIENGYVNCPQEINKELIKIYNM